LTRADPMLGDCDAFAVHAQLDGYSGDESSDVIAQRKIPPLREIEGRNETRANRDGPSATDSYAEQFGAVGEGRESPRDDRIHRRPKFFTRCGFAGWRAKAAGVKHHSVSIHEGRFDLRATKVDREGEPKVAARDHNAGTVKEASHVPTQKSAIVTTIEPSGHQKL
jgi:hypothetical protein